jgi:hypothetical protein
VPARVAVFIDGANVYRAFKAVFGWTRYSPSGSLQVWLQDATL